jgi:Mn-dependent DtxR family transcriptional regulator
MLDIDCQILKIIYRNKGIIRLNQIQTKLEEINYGEIALSTINSCLERLEKACYIIWVRYSPVRLTEEGINLAKELIRHAQLLELLLFNELELSVDDAHTESEKLNLTLSCDLINRICEKYDHPTHCPCGYMIQNSKNCFCEEEHKKVS